MKRQKFFRKSADIHKAVVRPAARQPRDPQKSSRILVVISYYDARPPANLLNLLRAIETRDAGLKFDICIVVNRESGRNVDLPKLTASVRLLSRPNTGMNIGAWDYGWRENPDYDYYVFLQDECVILRDGWLQGLIDCVMDPSVGIVGECINRRWLKSWTELTWSGDDDGSAATATAGNLIAKRARLALEFMAARGIPPGESGCHVRSLVWAISRETLRQLEGFPIGSDYEECIAAEISVSRRIESFGLSVQQAYRTPFFFVGHSQWINTYPGTSSSVSYVDWARKHFSVKSFPFPIVAGKGSLAERAEQLAKRVETERGLFDSGLILPPHCGFLALLVVIIDGALSELDLAETVLSWSTQSAPYVDLVLVATDEFLFEKVAAWKTKSTYEDFWEIRLCKAADWVSEGLAEYEFVVFARPGDQLHPSLGAVLATLDAAEQPDIIIWNERRSNRGESGGWLFKQPSFQPFTLRSVGYIGMAYAVRPGLIKGFPYDFVDDLLHNDSHLFHLWLAQDSGNVWTTHPEFLGCRSLRPGVPLHLDYGNYLNRYRELLQAEKEMEILPFRNGHVRSALIPTRRPSSVSVIASFRDRPQETIACLRSVIGQRMASARVEVILINNRSTEESLEEIREFLDKLKDTNVDIKLIDYDGPFNHSRQTNLGVKASSGEVLVFLNNDAEFMTDGVLDEMSAWALSPGVGTVGCQIVDARLQLLCAGIRAREGVLGLHASLVEESREESYSNVMHEVLANTFACAVIARSQFEQIGWLNELEFPNGYNDVEYCLRTRKQGLRNLYLGHLHVKHTPGTSRGRCDETLQKVLLRKRYSELLMEGVLHLSYEWRPDGPGGVRRSTLTSIVPAEYQSPVAIAVLEEAPVGLKKALRIFYRASIWWVQRRILS
jgi:GT2 family glycosyltransferase